jgi:hydroxymethylpyrimidine/phosphomethylpyrimidine kinase
MATKPKIARVLAIAGSDSGGGAGIQADIKTITMLGGYAATAVTAVTVQDTTGVHDIHAVPVSVVVAQIEAVIGDIGVDAVKIGMLGSREVIEAVAGVLTDVSVPIVLDPVMVAKGGAHLLKPEAVEALMSLLVPMADVVTPNIVEAEALSGKRIVNAEEAKVAGEAILRLGAKAVMVKGAHLKDDMITDWLLTPGKAKEWLDSRIPTKHTHGTGCTLASAIATGLAQGMTLEQAGWRARDFVRQAIMAAPGLGSGHGPLGHSWPLAR